MKNNVINTQNNSIEKTIPMILAKAPTSLSQL